jgi:hypothetical protein
MMIDVSTRARWARPLFLALSALAVVLVIVSAREVMLPIVLGLLIAYVLMPVVRWVESYRVPRGAAIVLVYVIVLGSMGLFIRAVAPRMASELTGLARELPTMVTKAKQNWIPVLKERLRVIAPPADPAPEEPALIVKPRPDGSIAVELPSGGIEVRKTREGHVIDKDRAREPFDPDKMVEASIQASAFSRT